MEKPDISESIEVTHSKELIDPIQLSHFRYYLSMQCVISPYSILSFHTVYTLSFMFQYKRALGSFPFHPPFSVNFS